MSATRRRLSAARRSKLPLLFGFGLATAIASLPFLDGSTLRLPTQAQAQVAVSLEFRRELEIYGRWTTHRRWGAVWVPEQVDRDWRPYRDGRWVYTEEWGWYWLASEEEPWGWITYHYGRWANDRDLGWFWIPGDEWGPAWVQWRRGTDYVGWAPLPPEDVIVEYEEEPSYWYFVRPRDLIAPRVVAVFLPPQRLSVYIRETVVVNRTIYVTGQRRLAINPGVPPAYIAAAIGRPVRATEVRPPVLRGTIGVRNAIEIRPDRPQRERVRVTTRETQTRIEPATTVPPPQKLERGEPGRLGDRPPAAAQTAPAAPDRRGPGEAKDRQPPAITKEKEKDRQPPAVTKEKDRGPGEAKDKDRQPPAGLKEKDRAAPVMKEKDRGLGEAKDKDRQPLTKEKGREPPAAIKEKDRPTPPGAEKERRGPGTVKDIERPAPPAMRKEERQAPPAAKERQAPGPREERGPVREKGPSPSMEKARPAAPSGPPAGAPGQQQKQAPGEAKQKQKQDQKGN